MAETWMTVQQAAAHLGLSTKTVERWMKSGVLPSPLLGEGSRKVCLETPPIDTGPSSDGLRNSASK